MVRTLSRSLLALLALLVLQLGLSPALAADAVPAASASHGEQVAVQPRTNAEIRQWYNDQVAVIASLDIQWRRQGLAPEERARRAHAIRHDARIKARDFMPDKAEVEMLRARDREKYGNPDGPGFEDLVARNREKGLTGDAVYDDIVGSSNRTDRATNEKFGVTPQARAP
jgi:hypothetical protein